MSKIKYLVLMLLVFGAFMLNGCIYIPPNDHVGKPAAHSYKDPYYYDDDYYYYHGRRHYY